MASVSFDYECELEDGFIMDPNVHRRVGYVTALNGFGLKRTLTPDLQVSLPFYRGADKSAAPTYKQLTYTAPTPTSPIGIATVVGVIKTFGWPGGVGDPITLEFYVSQENAAQIKTLQQLTLATTLVSTLSWWIADYDQECKKWFEQAYPLGAGTITGHINGRDDPELDVDLTPTKVKSGIDVNAYKVRLVLVPRGRRQVQVPLRQLGHEEGGQELGTQHRMTRDITWSEVAGREA